MASLQETATYEELLLQFIREPDPLLAMLEWITAQMMQLEASQEVGAPKGKYATNRTAYFSGTRWRFWGRGLEDSLQCYAFSHLDARNFSSTNVLERLNREIRRRSRVASPFPSTASRHPRR